MRPDPIGLASRSSRGRVVLIPPNTAFAAGCVGTVARPPSNGGGGGPGPGRIFDYAPTEAEQAMIRRLIGVLEKPSEANPLMASFLAQAVINPALAAVPTDYWEGRVADKRMAEVLQRLREGGPKVSNAELAREAGMNANAFIRKFRQAVGHTPHQYLLRLRIEQACMAASGGLDDGSDRGGGQVLRPLPFFAGVQAGDGREPGKVSGWDETGRRVAVVGGGPGPGRHW